MMPFLPIESSIDSELVSPNRGLEVDTGYSIVTLGTMNLGIVWSNSFQAI